MIYPPGNDHVYRLVMECQEKVADVNETLTQATFDSLSRLNRH
jgi:hypothetical protein